MMPELTITEYDRPNMRAEAAAIRMMADAFDPQFGEAWSGQQLSAFTSLSGVRLSLAQVDATYLGFTLARHVADEAELLLLAVAKSWQKKGVGAQLVNHVMVSARLSGVKSLHLEVRSNNPAIYFYDKMGFENVHRRPAYYKGYDGKTYDALSYRVDV